MKCMTFTNLSEFVYRLSREINEFAANKNIKAVEYHNAQYHGDDVIIATVMYEEDQR